MRKSFLTGYLFGIITLTGLYRKCESTVALAEVAETTLTQRVRFILVVPAILPIERFLYHRSWTLIALE